MKKIDEDKLKQKAVLIRRKVLGMIVDAKASHIGSAYSSVDLLVYLYEHFLNISIAASRWDKRDRFILSKGWGVSALYAVLADKGILSPEKLSEYCKNGSKLVGTSTRNGTTGIEATTGSMGHGLPIGVGMALAAKLKNQKHRVVVLMSDGECNEGSIWEAALQAGHHKLDNIVVIIDHNKWQSFGRTQDILNLESLNKKWESFNWGVVEIDGHNFSSIEKGFSKVPYVRNKPTVIIANTIKGKGVSVFEDRNEWHYKTPGEGDIAIALEELHI